MLNHQPAAHNYYHYPYAQQLAHHGHYHDPALSSLGCPPPLQLPLQQHSEQQLRLAAAGFQHPNFRSHQQQVQSIPIRRRHQHRQTQQTMAFPQQSEEQLAEFQKLSNEYEPEVTGPLVGQREPSTTITTEYAAADPVYQTKTADLPQKYSHYRKVRGDGRCGWRAIAFGYFEVLIRLGDGNKFLEAETLLRSLSNVLNQAGFQPFLYEDFADATFELLRKVSNALPSGQADTVLNEGFNDDEVQNYIITYLKTITAGWMRAHPTEYAPWLLGETVEHYCDHNVMPHGSEIDNVSLSALKDVMLAPIGITLEVLYLDRTEGSEVNMHRFDPINPPGIGTIRLLYRPGHYDILYKAEDFPHVVDFPQAAAPVTYLQYASQVHHEPAQAVHAIPDYGLSDFMTMIPGMSYANPHQAWMSTSSYGSDFFSTPAPAQQCTQPVPTPVTPAPQSQIQSHPLYVQATPSQLEAPPTQMPQEMTIRTVSHGTLAHAGFQHQLGGPFRPSHWELEPDFAQATSQVQFQTTQFRNSHFNTAHFLNPDFQPEEWRPDDEYVTATTTKTTRHRNSG